VPAAPVYAAEAMKQVHIRLLCVATLAVAACASTDDGDSGVASASPSTTEVTDGAATGTTAASTGNGPSSAVDGSSAADQDSGAADQDSGAADGDSGAADSAESDGSTGSQGSPCDDPGLVWHSGNKTNYESYPDPGSEECIEFNGCEYVGQFAACENTMPERWVMAHDIVAVFPLDDLGLHRLCLRSGDTSMVVTAIDTCADSDCDGCCTENLGDADALIDLEKYTNERFGVEDGAIEWADLGAGDPSFDGCN
jgi:hypothetical protein